MSLSKGRSKDSVLESSRMSLTTRQARATLTGVGEKPGISKVRTTSVKSLSLCHPYFHLPMLLFRR